MSKYLIIALEDFENLPLFTRKDNASTKLSLIIDNAESNLLERVKKLGRVIETDTSIEQRVKDEVRKYHNYDSVVMRKTIEEVMIKAATDQQIISEAKIDKEAVEFSELLESAKQKICNAGFCDATGAIEIIESIINKLQQKIINNESKNRN